MKILLCTDGSGDAARAARFGLRLVRRGIDSLQLLDVIDNADDAEGLIRDALEALRAELRALGGTRNENTARPRR